MKTQYDPSGYPFSTNMNKQTIEQIEESIKSLEELKKTFVTIKCDDKTHYVEVISNGDIKVKIVENRSDGYEFEKVIFDEQP